MERTVTTTEATAAATTAAAAATATAATITTQYEHKMSETMKQQRGGVNHGGIFCIILFDIVVLIRLTSL